jgi:phosphonate transport system permease protein
VLGFFASTAWWAGDPTGGQSALGRALRRTVAPASYAFFRTLIALMRSIHELLWAVLFLAALGLSEVAAILAIAIPYAGTLAKVFSEMVDEAPRDAAQALRAAGASRLQVYCFALIPRALPDMVAYGFYRLECALRSSAIMGFFGFPTLGLYVRQSFSSTNYGEVWTYLYVLIALVVLLDAWSAGMRRRISA